jgi:hypothetical protein
MKIVVMYSSVEIQLTIFTELAVICIAEYKYK